MTWFTGAFIQFVCGCGRGYWGGDVCGGCVGVCVCEVWALYSKVC